METLLRASPEVVSRKKLIESVWGEDPPDSNSLKVHLFHLRRAINTPRPILHTVAGQGFAIREEQPA